MDTSLEELLGDEPKVEAVVPVVEAEPEPAVEPVEPVRDEKGRFASKGVEEGAPPAQNQLPPEEYKALKEERTKRQTLETQLAQMQQQIEQLQAPQQPPAPPPDMWEDTPGWQQHFGGQIVQQASLNARLDMSEMMMRQASPDFEEMKATFLSMMKDNPTLQQQALSDPHPWNKAYQIAKNHKTMQDLGATDIDGLKAKLREELMAEMAQQPQSRPGLPASLSTERNVGSRSGPAWSGPSSLSDLLA